MRQEFEANVRATVGESPTLTIEQALDCLKVALGSGTLTETIQREVVNPTFEARDEDTKAMFASRVSGSSPEVPDHAYFTILENEGKYICAS